MQVKPLPGYMIVKLESLYKDTGLIRVPERYKKAPHIVGTVIDIVCRNTDTRTLGHEIKTGHRIIISHLGGRHLRDDEWIYPITTKRRDTRGKKYLDSVILAIVPPDVDLKPHTQNVERCQFCGEAKPGARQNMMMVNGVCPRCHRERNGDMHDDTLTITDEESAAMLGVA